MPVLRCPICQSIMRDARVTTDESARRISMFGCDHCARAAENQSPVDPMRTHAAGWVNADLHPPK